MLPDFRVRQRDFLLEISRAMTAQLDLGEVLRLVLHASTVMLAGKVGLVALRDPNDHYVIHATLGVESDHLAELNQHLDEMVGSTNWGYDREFINTKLNHGDFAGSNAASVTIFAACHC